MLNRPPPLADRDSEPWWEMLGRHRLALQQCDECQRFRWPARAMCGECGSLRWRWVDASGRATIASWIVNHHGFTATFGSPYTVVLARLDEQDDILIPGGWAGATDGADLRIGLSVTAGFDDLASAGEDPAVTLLRWQTTG